MSHADKKRRYAEALVSIEMVLEARWPKAFFLNQTQRLPLKRGIRDDILAAGVELTPSKLSRATTGGPLHGSPARMSEHPRRLSLADLRAAAQARKAATA